MIKLTRNIIAVAMLSLIFTSCSTMNKSECLSADWKTIGYGDGTKGYAASRISQHRSACADYGISPNLNAYNAGRNEGLTHYCIPSTGYNRGVYGSKYNGVCVSHNEKDFLEAYNYGLYLYKENKLLSKLKSEYSQDESYISRLERRIDRKESLMISGKISNSEAHRLLMETKEMIKELDQAKYDLAILSSDIDSQYKVVHKLRQESKY